MRKRYLMRLLVVALWSSSAWAQWAQRIQNFDMFISMGPTWSRPHAIAGTNVTLTGSSGLSSQFNYGYQVARFSAASLLLDISLLFPGGSAWKANVPVSASGRGGMAITSGLRLMIPVNSRLSFYGVSNGGVGFFSSPVVTGGASPSVSGNDSTHGVFVFGGGADVRLGRSISLRAEVRDLVTAKGMEGAPGRHRVLPLFGVAFHF